MVWAPLILAALGAGAEMLGDALRELAALVVVFVPLELWKTQQGNDFHDLMRSTIEAAVSLFLLGMFSKYVSMSLYRMKRDLEGKDGN